MSVLGADPSGDVDLREEEALPAFLGGAVKGADAASNASSPDCENMQTFCPVIL